MSNKSKKQSKSKVRGVKGVVRLSVAAAILPFNETI